LRRSFRKHRDAARYGKAAIRKAKLDLLVMTSLSFEPWHGVGISRRITQITKDAFQVSFGSLFPTLHRMEESGWLEAEWRSSDNNRRAKYYRLTSAGRAKLKDEERRWKQLVMIIAESVK
jgi:transcriptional regulator